MNLKNKLEIFFNRYKKQISIENLIKELNIKKEEIDILLDNLYELEKNGKIFFDKNNTYIHVPKEFCYELGILKKSKQGNFFVKEKDGTIILINDNVNDKIIQEGDFVYANKTVQKHPKQFQGTIVRIIKREELKNNHNYIVQGILRREGTHYYISVNDKKIYISKNELNTAFAGDLVNVRINNSTGKVINVLKRHHLEHVFRCEIIDDQLKWMPVGSSYGYFELDKNKFNRGDMIVAKVLGKKLEFVKKINNSHTTQDDINALVIDYGFARTFSDSVLEEAKKLSKKIEPKDLINRVDLRNLETFTIDPADAKDLDDAVSLECDNDLYHLYVHTANPSHYVKINSPIFNEAFKRCFSVYPSTDVIPMLPDAFSSGVCSLNENGDKLSITCRMDIDKNGNVTDFEIFKSVIHSDKQMNYDDVNRFLENRNSCPDYLPFYDTLSKMQELSSILQNKKDSRGSVSFESREKEFILDAAGNPIEIKEIQRGEAQNIIENFMLLANEHISKYAYFLNLPYIYRNHEKPSIQKRNSLKNELNQKGYFIQKIGNIDNPRILQQFLTDLVKGKNKEERKIICESVLKSMTRAFYDFQNIGHYGLALDCYGTFTSPARKFSDFLNHMVIEEFLDNGIESKKMKIYEELIQDICEYISQKQKDADLLEQEIDQYMFNKYASNFMNQENSAKILFMNQYGIYVKDEHGLTGVIPRSKKMIIKDKSILYYDHEYKINEQIPVILKEQKEKELLFELAEHNEKRLVKKRKVMKE